MTPEDWANVIYAVVFGPPLILILLLLLDIRKVFIAKDELERRREEAKP